MMNNKEQASYRLLPVAAILSILIGSATIVHNGGFFNSAFAQQSNNPTSGQAQSQSPEDVVKSLMSPKSLMESVINQTRNTNATNFAANQILSKVNGSNSTGSINGMKMNSTGSINGMKMNSTGSINGMKMNSTGSINGMKMNSTGSMNSVIQKLQNSNATNFATHAIIEALKR
jgi:hypothetical protein